MKEIKQIEKAYTENTEAYKLYQKGRYFWHQRTIEKSIEYFEDALEIDSNYSLAYAGLADAWFMRAVSRPTASPNENYVKCKEYALKAKSIDSTLSDPHVTLGALALFIDWDWDLTKTELKQALKLNPSNAEAYYFYTLYFKTMGKLEEAEISINRAIDLDPNAFMKYMTLGEICYHQKKFEETLEAMDKVLELIDYKWAYRDKFRVYFHLGDYSKAFNEYKKFLNLSQLTENYLNEVNEIFSESGINGILRYEISRLHNKSNLRNHHILALYHAMLGNKDSTLFYLEKDYIYREAIRFNYIKVNLDYEFLHGDPRFNTLLEKLDLPVD